jgi:hypothetical protein
MLLGGRYARQLKARLTADPLLERADTLVQYAKINAIEMFTPLFREFPCLRAVEPENWEFILTVAGVFVAATRLKNQHFGNAREQKLWDKAYRLFIHREATRVEPSQTVNRFLKGIMTRLQKRGMNRDLLHPTQ